MKKIKGFFNKLECFGICILDLRKMFMFDLYYNYMKDKYGDRIELFFIDMDLFMY